MVLVHISRWLSSERRYVYVKNKQQQPQPQRQQQPVASPWQPQTLYQQMRYEHKCLKWERLCDAFIPYIMQIYYEFRTKISFILYASSSSHFIVPFNSRFLCFLILAFHSHLIWLVPINCFLFLSLSVPLCVFHSFLHADYAPFFYKKLSSSQLSVHRIYNYNVWEKKSHASSKQRSRLRHKCPIWKMWSIQNTGEEISERYLENLFVYNKNLLWI